MKVTLVEVAKAAGVSLATVDRVLNGREGVRADTVRRVEEALAKLDYHPSRLSARLSRARSQRLVYVLPGGPSSFMRHLHHKVAETAEALSGDGITIEIAETDVFEPSRLAATLATLAGNADGVAVVALDHILVNEAINDLATAGIPVVTLVSDAPRSRRTAYVGIDNVAAGRTAGLLMARMLGNSVGSVGVVMGSANLRDHVERQFGFTQVLTEMAPALNLLPAVQGRDDFAKVGQLTAALLAEHSDLVGLYSIGAGNRGLIDTLRESGRTQDVVVVAHELTPASRKALIDGSIDAVIHQNPGHEARSAARLLLNALGIAPLVEDQERIGIQIYVKENLPA
jgi:LacI family transcriptional regulator